MDLIPLFPLNLVLFPGGQLPLRIFEPRYTDLVSECLRTDSGFGVCLIKNGFETGGGAQCFDVGTYAKIVDWSKLEDGLLGITAVAGERFRVKHFSERSNGLLEGRIQWLTQEPKVAEIEQKYHSLQLLLSQIFEHYDIECEDKDNLLQDADWLTYRLTEMLPLDLQSKQILLEMDDSQQRLSHLQQMINETNITQLAN
jgi:uncharacterized protein